MLSCLSGCLLFVDGLFAVLFFLLFEWAGLTVLAVVGACIIAIPIWIWLIKQSIKESKEQKEREESDSARRREAKRSTTACLFQDGISQNDFEQMAHRIAKRIRRLNISVCGPIVYGEVESQSGISTWRFEVDFNDFGHITGNWWITQRENRDSNIPNRFADLMEHAIKERLNQL